MLYQSLYRQYRPMGFQKGFVGQEHIVRTLQNSLQTGRLAHAFLFSGPRGTGKTTTAKILAKAVNCLSADKPVMEPCNQCELCLAVNQGNAMDVIEMDAATNRGIEEVRDLRDRVKYAPALGRYKVYIIDEVHMLTTEAFNALLKTLEEPPAHVIFILATTEPQKIPATILSRCQRFDFRPLTEDMIASHLQSIAQQTGVNLNQEAASILAFRAQGGMRDAIGLLEQVIAFAQEDITPEQVWQALGTVDKARLVELVNAMAAKDIGAVLKLLDEFGNMGLDFRQLLTDLLELLREKLLQVTGARKIKISDDLGLKTAPEIMTMMDSVASGLQDSRRWTHPRLATELIMIKICNSLSLKTGPVSERKQPPRTPQKKVNKEKAVTGEKWDEVLSLVKGESISSYAWLKEATPFIEADSLVLEYPGNYGLHCENIVKPEHRQVLVLAFRQVLGVDAYTVRTREHENRS